MERGPRTARTGNHVSPTPSRRSCRRLLLPVQPDSCCLVGATGPRRGAELLCGRLGEAELAAIADGLARSLSVPYDVMEDALCIWQKTR